VPDYTDPQSLNRYSYCRNNPLIYVDPSGHSPRIGAYMRSMLETFGLCDGISIPLSATPAELSALISLVGLDMLFIPSVHSASPDTPTESGSTDTSIEPLGTRRSYLLGAGFSAVGVTGFEASRGLLFTPSWNPNEFRLGFFASGGLGSGVNVFADLFGGYIDGDVNGTTANLNVVPGPVSLTSFINPSTGEIVGGTFGVGPPWAMPVSASGTISETVTATISLRQYMGGLAMLYTPNGAFLK